MTKIRCDRSELRPAVRHDEAAQREINEKGVFFRYHHQGESYGEDGEEAQIIRTLKILPEQPEIHDRPEGEDAIDQSMLRQVNLQR